MSYNSKTFTAANNSLETSIHETGNSPIALTGNPYTDLAAYGIGLHGCTIRYRSTPKENGNTITGVFNISGRKQTAGATSYEDLILYLVENYKEYRRYVAECRYRRRQRYKASWESRHLGLTFYNCNITFK